MTTSANANATRRRETSRWRALLGIESDPSRAALSALTRRFFDAESEGDDSFRRWRTLWRASSATTFNAKARAAFEPYRAALDADSATKLDQLGEPDRLETLLFLLQTRVAQTVLAVVAIDFALDDLTLDGLFAPFPYAWGAFVRRRLGLDFNAIQTLQLPETARTRDPFGAVYESFFSAPLRRTLGEFYTPPALAEFLYARACSLRGAFVGRRSDAAPTVLDPTCGAGVFLTTAVRAALRDGRAPSDALASVYGNDLNPLAALVARVNLLYAAFSQSDASTPKRRRAALDALIQKNGSRADALLPVDVLDAVSLTSPISDSKAVSEKRRTQKFDLALGNPPWIAWDKLPREYRSKTASSWRRYGQFTLSGREAQFGGAKKELAGLVATICVAERLKDDGLAAFVLPRNLFQSSRAGEGFRKFGADAPWRFAALEFDDFTELNLFPSVASAPTALFVRAHATTRYPIVARRWRQDGAPPAGAPSSETLRAASAFAASFDVGTAAPATARPGAPLALRFPNNSRPQERRKNEARARADALVEKLLEKTERSPETPRYRAQLGANAAGASGVFWFRGNAETRLETDLFQNLAESGRRKVPFVAVRLERELLYPILRWRDLDEFYVAPPSALMLVPQDARRRRGFDLETMSRRYPLTLSYLKQFEDVLRTRAACKRFCRTAPFWSLFNVDESTFAPYKVAWRRMDSRLRAAVVAPTPNDARPLLVQETLAFVPVADLAEADYLAAALNSAPARERAAERFEPGSQSFGSPGVLNAIPIPRFDPASPVCQELSTLGKQFRREASTLRET